MTPTPLFLACLAAAYLVGAIPFAFIISKAVMGIDIRHHGSGNVGATNVIRVVGKRAGGLCLVLDFMKGLLPTVIAEALIQQPLEVLGIGFTPEKAWLLVGAAAIVGHCFPIYLMTVGGKGIATSLGVFGALMPGPTLILFVVGVTFIALTGYVAIASCLAAVALVPLAWLFGYYSSYIWVSALLAVIIVFRHQSNIRRFLTGQEPRLWDKAAIGKRDAGVGVDRES